MKYFYSVFSLAILVTILAFSLSCLNGYFYPVKYKDEITISAQEFGLDPALVAAVANVESGYNSNAKSSKGAVGIMQLLPSTAKWLADNLGEQYSENLLYNPSYNIRLGSYYLSYLTKYFEDEKAAICAYNAGQTNVRSWLTNPEYSTDQTSLTKIPYPETQNYLSKVQKNIHYYQKRYK